MPFTAYHYNVGELVGKAVTELQVPFELFSHYFVLKNPLQLKLFL
jgi:hypothetical protein